MSWRSHRDRLALVAGVLLPLGVALLLVPFRDSLPNTDAALVLVVVIVAVAATGHRVGDLLAAASAAVWFRLLSDRAVRAAHDHASHGYQDGRAGRVRLADDRNRDVFSIRDGRIVAMRACHDRAEALEVAGIE